MICDHIENCLPFIMSNEATNHFEGEISLYPAPTKLMQIVHADHFGPLSETPNGVKHLLILVDAFMRFSWVNPIKSTTSK